MIGTIFFDGAPRVRVFNRTRYNTEDVVKVLQDALATADLAPLSDREITFYEEPKVRLLVLAEWNGSKENGSVTQRWVNDQIQVIQMVKPERDKAKGVVERVADLEEAAASPAVVERFVRAVFSALSLNSPKAVNGRIRIGAPNNPDMTEVEKALSKHFTKTTESLVERVNKQVDQLASRLKSIDGWSRLMGTDVAKAVRDRADPLLALYLDAAKDSRRAHERERPKYRIEEVEGDEDAEVEVETRPVLTVEVS